MNKIKSHILEFIWSGKDVAGFEQWLYNMDIIEFEKLIGAENYVELISYDYKNLPLEQLKEFLKTILPEEMVQEFKEEFKKRKSKVIKGKCIKKIALQYHGKEDREWGVEIGKEYEFLIINLDIKRGNHAALVNYVDRTNDFRPAGFVPLELFDIDLTNISDFYHKVVNEKNETTIEIVTFSENTYRPNQYSFWEDFYDDDKKAIDTYYDTLEKLGVNHIW